MDSGKPTDFYETAIDFVSKVWYNEVEHRRPILDNLADHPKNRHGEISMISLPPVDTRKLTSKEYRRCYNMGWNASGGNPRSIAGLPEAESSWLSRHGYRSCSAEHDAWIDGWLDFASGRDKYHFETCDGDCGEH